MTLPESNQDRKNFILIYGNSLNIDDFTSVVSGSALVCLSEEAKKRIVVSHESVLKLVESKIPAYGINTGFGVNSKISIPIEDTLKLQENIIKSHSAGVGGLFSDEVVRGALLLRLNCFCLGYSGVSLELVELLVDVLNKNVVPLVYSRGSVGSSGDLAPLAQMSLPIIGLGKAKFNGTVYSGEQAMKLAGIPTLQLSYKEGLALTNGFQFGTSIGAVCLHHLKKIADLGDILGGMFVEALKGVGIAFSDKLQLARPHESQIECAKNIVNILEGSSLVDWKGESNVHSSYSIKCIPQVLGSLRCAISHAEKVILIEMNSATDNPLIFSYINPISESGGNFHGQVVGNVLAYLNIALGASVFKNFNGLVTRIHDEKLSNGLPNMLVSANGLNSGFMIAQYTVASLYNEYKALAYPVTVDSIPTCGMAEDVVSMGTNQAKNLLKSIDLCYDVLAISLLVVVQGLYFRQKTENLNLGCGTGKVFKFVLNELEKEGFAIPYEDSKNPLYEWIESARKIIVKDDLILLCEKEFQNTKKYLAGLKIVQ